MTVQVLRLWGRGERGRPVARLSFPGRPSRNLSAAALAWEAKRIRDGIRTSRRRGLPHVLYTAALNPHCARNLPRVALDFAEAEGLADYMERCVVPALRRLEEGLDP